jgi:hypothetical protein
MPNKIMKKTRATPGALVVNVQQKITEFTIGKTDRGVYLYSSVERRRARKPGIKARARAIYT